MFDSGRCHRKQPKVDALRQCKYEILEAYRSGLNVYVPLGGGKPLARKEFVTMPGEHLRKDLQILVKPFDRCGKHLLNDSTETSADCGTNQMQNLLQMRCGTI